MKFLFIVQGEGRGHLTQAITMESLLRRHGHEVVEVLVGKSNSRLLPEFFNRQIHAPVKQFSSPNFLPTPANKRVSLTRSITYNLMRLPLYAQSIRFISRRIQDTGADMVINFYELLTGLTYLLYNPRVPQISIGHQYLFLHKEFAFPHKNRTSLKMLKFFTRITCLGATKRLALSFRPMADDIENQILVIPPLLRKEVIELTSSSLYGENQVTRGDYIHGYMVNSGFAENLIQWHKAHPSVPLHFFWDKQCTKEIQKIDSTLTFHPINDKEFLHYMAGCKAYATTAGFESVCEAMYLGKPMLMVPAHIEQDCNAYDAMCSGAGIIADNFNIDRLVEFAKNYEPNQKFIYWARSSEEHLINILEQLNNAQEWQTQMAL